MQQLTAHYIPNIFKNYILSQEMKTEVQLFAPIALSRGLAPSTPQRIFLTLWQV